MQIKSGNGLADQNWELMRTAFKLRQPTIIYELVNQRDKIANEAGLPRLKVDRPRLYIKSLVDIEADHTHRIAASYFRAFCDIWDNVLKRQRTREFYEAVFAHNLRPLFIDRRQSFHSRLRRSKLQRRISSEQVDKEIKRFDDLIFALQSLWRSNLESRSYEVDLGVQREISLHIPETVKIRRGYGEKAAHSVRSDRKPGPKFTPRERDFIEYAGRIWGKEISSSENGRVRIDGLIRIAKSLDGKALTPPADFLEGAAATELKRFNSMHSNAGNGPILTWTELVRRNASRNHPNTGEKIPFRTDMRRRLSRCAKMIRN